jgi:hypothetical protein
MLGSGAQSLRASDTSTKPARRVTLGCPVKLEISNISFLSDGTSSTSTVENTRAISIATFRRNRSACTKSTADKNRDCRNRFGHASGTCTLSCRARPLSVNSSNAAAPSANRSGINESFGQSGSVTSPAPCRACGPPRCDHRRRSPASLSSAPGYADPRPLPPAPESSQLAGTLDVARIGPVIAWSTSIASSTLRVIDPSVGRPTQSSPRCGTRPNVGAAQ